MAPAFRDRSPIAAPRTLVGRRNFLQDIGSGAAGIALAGLLARSSAASTEPLRPQIDLAQPCTARPPHFSAKANRLLMVICCGGVSHVDSFDWKPELVRLHDQPLPGSANNFLTFQGENGNISRPLWEFRPRGQSGKMVSDLFPGIASLSDDLCFIHSMTAKSNTHGPADCQMNTGSIFDGFPSVGSWVSYALGADTEDLPAFVAIPDSRGVPMGGPNDWGNGFLPASFQGTAFNTSRPLANLDSPRTSNPHTERAIRDVLDRINAWHLEKYPEDSELAARIASYELAARMQLSVPEVGDISRESAATRAAYGADDPDAVRAGFARNCLLARRLLERGVRVVQLYHGAQQMGALGAVNWDGHKALYDQYAIHARTFDGPLTALVQDLKQRGLLDDTLVVWVTEFGRMPTFQKGASGRDHNTEGFTVWLTGPGVKRGFSYGATDDFGHKAVQDVTTIYELHATILHLMGLDHERLSVYHNGLERRLTDVHGKVIGGILG